MRAVAANLGSGNQNLKSKRRFHLPADLLERLPKKLLHAPATQADDMSVLLLQTGLVVMLIAAKMHEIEFVDQTALLQHLKGAVYSDPIELGVDLLGHLK